MRFESTGRAQIHSVKCCVLFDRKDGAIRHVHHVVTIQGAAETPDSEVEKRALKLARELGIDTKQTQLIHVDAQALDPQARYKVDPKTRKLIRIERTPLHPTPGKR